MKLCLREVIAMVVAAAPLAVTMADEPQVFLDREALAESDAVEAELAARLSADDWVIISSDGSTTVGDEGASASVTTEMEEKLAARVADLLAARVEETSEPHEALLNSWGGVCWFPVGSAKGEKYRSMWLAPDNPRAIRSLSVDGVEVEYQTNQPGEEMVSTRVITDGMSFGATTCFFTFDPPVSEAVALGTVKCDLYFPMLRNDGTELCMGFRMTWSHAHQEWLPNAILYAKPDHIGTTIQFF